MAPPVPLVRCAVGLALVVAMLTGCSATAEVAARNAHPNATENGPTVPPVTELPPATQVPSGSDAPPPTDVPATDVPATEVPPTDVPPTVAPPAAADPDGIGDPLFPDLGNPGIDVEHYDVTLAYNPTDDVLRATVALTVEFTERREAFTLDATAAVAVSRVTIDGVAAKFTRHANELAITPGSPIEDGARRTVSVTYTSDPKDRTSAAGLPSGWFDVQNAGSYVLNEPDAARTWLPSNDHPSDKATWSFHITVPAGLTAIANGRLVSHTTGTAGATWNWAEDRPMATYLVQLITGKYSLLPGTGPNGLPMLSAVLTADRTLMQPFVDVQAGMIDFFDHWFGPYPLDRYGIAMTDSFSGLAMEDQERPLFSREDFLSGQVGGTEQMLLSHELAHQWFGDAVTPAQWDDIWLNESFATYGQWMWLDHAGVTPLADQANAALGYQRVNPTGKPTVDNMFGYESYDGGAVVLHALRATIGDADFFQLLKNWSHLNNGASRSTADFIALAETVSGRDLTKFFDTWLFSTDVPSTYPSPPP